MSHAHLDSNAAIFLQKAIEESFRPNLSVFCTSLPRDRFTTESVAKIEPKLREQLALADMVIVLASNSSKGSPWVQFESIIAFSNTIIFGGSLGAIGEFSLYERGGIYMHLLVEGISTIGTVAEGHFELADTMRKLDEKLRDKVEFPRIHSTEAQTDPAVTYRHGFELQSHDVGAYFGPEWIRADYPDITKPGGLKILWKWIELWLEIEPAGVLDFPDIAKKLRKLLSD